MPRKGNSNVSKYLEKVEVHFSGLVNDKKMSENSKESFFVDFLGCDKGIHKHWYSTGIRKVYYSLLWCLDEIKNHKKRIAILEKQLNEITKK